jgi:hypothetical protein
MELDAATRIAGFPLKEIKRALSLAGLMNRNDVAEVARKLECPVRQALHVVDELEKQGFLIKLEKPGRVSLTEKGRQLVHLWSPPRRYTPIIERESEEGVCNEVFDDASCGLWHDEDDTIMTEEAKIEAGIFVEQEGERLIEVSVVVPDDQDHPDEITNIETTIFMSIAEATRLSNVLQTSIEAAKAELARRADIQAGRRKQKKTKGGGAPTSVLVRKPGPPDPRRRNEVPETWDSRLDWTPTRSAQTHADVQVPVPTKPKKTNLDRKRRASLAATLNELRGKSP